MIFVTVGVQLPFDRLITAMDKWAERNRAQQIVAQIGDTELKPRNLKSFRSLSPLQYDDMLHRARVVVAHAGMGSIITALQFAKPLLIMPRRAALGEHRNDHQQSTAKYVESQGLAIVAPDETILPDKLAELLATNKSGTIPAHASPQLLQTIATFIGNS